MIVFCKPWNLGYISTPGQYSGVIKKYIVDLLKLNIQDDGYLKQLLPIHGFVKDKIMYCAYKHIELIKVSNFEIKKQFNFHQPMKTFIVFENPINKLLKNYNDENLKKELPVEYRNCNNFDEFVNVLINDENIPTIFKKTSDLIKGHLPDFVIREKFLISDLNTMFNQFKLETPNFEEIKQYDLSLIKSSTINKISKFYKKDYMLYNSKEYI